MQHIASQSAHASQNQTWSFCIQRQGEPNEQHPLLETYSPYPLHYGAALRLQNLLAQTEIS